MDQMISDYTCDELYDAYCGLRKVADGMGSPFKKDNPIPRPTEDNPWVRLMLRTLISFLTHEIRGRLSK